MTENLPAEEGLEKVLETVDGATRRRAAHLSAKGILDGQIRDILLLSDEQVTAIKTSQEFKEKYAEEANEAIERQFTLEEGWNTLEEEALHNLISNLKYNKDPKFMLATAQIANRAERRSKQAKHQVEKIIDATKNENNNIVILNINKNYVERGGAEKTITMTARPAQIPLKQSDVPAPKLVDSILAPARERHELSATSQQMTDLEKMMQAAGVVFDQD